MSIFFKSYLNANNETDDLLILVQLVAYYTLHCFSSIVCEIVYLRPR